MKIRMKAVLKTFVFWFLLLLAAASFITAVITEGTMWEGTKFFAYQVFCILIPGEVLLLLVHFRLKSGLEKTGLSYALGYVLNIVIYYLLVPFGGKGFLPIAMVVISIFATTYLLFKLRKEKKSEKENTKELIVCIIFLGIILLLGIFGYVAVNLITPPVKENHIHKDILYWIGNAIELSNEYPPKNFRNILSVRYGYHFFSSIQLAVVNAVTNIRIYELGLYYQFIQGAALMVTGAFCLFRKCRNNIKVILLGMVFLFFTTGNEVLNASRYTSCLYLIPIGFDIALGLTCFMFFVFICQMQQKKFFCWYALITVLLFAGALGSKAPFGAVSICGIGIICFYWLLKKEWKKAFGYGLPILAAFFVIYMFVCSISLYSQGNTSQILLTAEEEKPEDEANQSEKEPESVLEETPGYFSFLYLSNYCIFGCAFAVWIIKLLMRIRTNVFDIACTVMFAVGVGISYSIRFFGNSQMYFGMAANIPALMFILSNARVLEGKALGNVVKVNLRRWIFLIGGILFINLGAYQWYLGYKKISVPEYIVRGVNNLNGRFEEKDENNITPLQAEAYNFLYQNTFQKDVLTSNFNNYIIGALSERYVLYTEDTRRLFEKNDFSVIKKLKKLGIKYLVFHTKKEPNSFELPTRYGNCVFHNQEVKIYRLLDEK